MNGTIVSLEVWGDTMELNWNSKLWILIHLGKSKQVGDIRRKEQKPRGRCWEVKSKTIQKLSI
jgi:hypothetical protein